MQYFSISRVGDREINEDYVEILNLDDKTVFILADGLGGHGCGEIASKEATEAIKCYFKTNLVNKPEEIKDILRDSIQAAHKRLGELQNQVGDTSSFKTTIVVLVITDDNIIWAHVGDSRLYHFERKKLVERSMDHSVPQMLVNAGKIREKQIRYHEDRSRLLRVLGAEDEISKPNITELEPRNRGAAFILCSDGFWEHIDEKHMERRLKKAKNPECWLSEMEKEILKNGKNKNMDNYSAIAIYI